MMDGADKTGRVLVIDDASLVRELVRWTLEKESYAVTEAADGIDGVRLFRESRFDLVITDLILPRMDGLEVITDIKREDPGAKIIAISSGGLSARGKSVNYLLSVAERLGANRSLLKPFTGEQILGAVRDLLTDTDTAGKV
ncbi:MAG: response regulator [Candidatus Nitrospinota bacterium M3_3B_026]